MEAANMAVNMDNVVFMAIEGHKKLTDDTRIADSGATCHITNDMKGMFDIKDVHESIKIGTGEETYATKCGKFRGEVTMPEGMKEVIISGMRYVPGFYVKLFSITSAMKKGAKITSEGMQLTVENGPMKLVFRQCLETTSSFVLGLEIKPKASKFAGFIGKSQKMDAQEWLRQLGHVSDDIMRRTATYYGQRLKEKFENCKNCTMGKSRQTNISKETVERATKPGERLFIDISSTEHESYGKAKFWLLVVDDATNFCWSFFLKSKNETKEVMIGLIMELKDKNNIKVEKVQCDNLGENHSFQQAAKQEWLGITFEFTARKTPQQNGCVEWKFATLFGHVRAMLNGAGFIEEHETL